MKKAINLFGLVVILGILLGASSCKKESGSVSEISDNQILSQMLNLPEEAFDYESISVPAHLDQQEIFKNDNTPPDNPITNHGATLGRVLFYDNALSKNNTKACASCHIQQFGFSDTAVLSEGFEGGVTGRHSMGLANARFRANGKFFWDERAGTLEEQVLMPIQDAVEMGMTLEELEIKLAGLDYYPILFKRAFGSEEITSDKISKALAQFVRSMISFSSKFDEGLKNHVVMESFSNFTAEENLGKSLFHQIDKGGCFQCHSGPAMVSDMARNNGLSNDRNDKGVGAVSNDAVDNYKFSVPSLRNIAVRPPYMQNGHLSSLEEVVLAYSSEIEYSNTLDIHLRVVGQNAAKKFNYTPQEVSAMVAFLNTITDNTFLTNPIYSNPFK